MVAPIKEEKVVISPSLKPQLSLLAQCTPALRLGQTLLQTPLPWPLIHSHLRDLQTSRPHLPWSQFNSTDLTYLLTPPLQLLKLFVDGEVSKPKGFSGVTLEWTTDFLGYAVERVGLTLSEGLRGFILLRSVTVLGKSVLPSLKKVDGLQPSDELLLTLVRLLLRLLQSQSQAPSPLPTGPPLSPSTSWPKSLISILIELVDHTSSLSLRLTSLSLLNYTFQHSIPLDQLPTVIPGLLSVTSRLLSRNPDTTQRDIFITTLNLILTCFRRVTQLPELLPPSTEITLPPPSSPSPWLVNLKKAVQVLLTKARQFSTHSNLQVKRAYLDLTLWCLLEGTSLTHDSRSDLLKSLLPLLIENQPTLTTRISESIIELLPMVDPLLPELWQQLHDQLIPTMTAGTESDKIALLRMLLGVQTLLGPKLEMILKANHHHLWHTWCKCLTLERSSLEEVDGPPTSLPSSHLTLTTLPSTSLTVGSPKFLYLDHVTTRELLEDFFNMVSVCSPNPTYLIDYGLSILRQPSWEQYHAPSLYIFGRLFPTDDPDGTSDLLCKGMVQAIHPSLPTLALGTPCLLLDMIPSLVEIIDEFRTPVPPASHHQYPPGEGRLIQSERTFLQQMTTCQVLLLLTRAAEVAQLSFRDYLFDTLYIIIEKLGHPNLEVSYTAGHCLEVIRKVCDYTDLLEMVRDNLDYLVHAVSQRLHPLELHPPAATMLIALFRLSRGADLYLLDDLFDLVADGLHAASGSHLPSTTVASFLQVVRAMVHPIVQCRSEREVTLCQELVLSDRPYGPSAPGFTPEVIDFLRQLREARTEREALAELTSERHSRSHGSFLDEISNMNLGENPRTDHDMTTPTENSKPSQVALQDDPVIVRCHTRLEKILSAARCYLSYSDPQCRAVALEIITGVATPHNNLPPSDKLTALRRHLDPSWHQLWPTLKLRLEDPDPIIRTRALDTAHALTHFSFDFLAARLAQELLPRLLHRHLQPLVSPLQIIRDLTTCQKQAADLAVHLLGHTPSAHLPPITRFDTIRHLLQAFRPLPPPSSSSSPTFQPPPDPHPHLLHLILHSLLPTLDLHPDPDLRDVAQMVRTHLLPSDKVRGDL